FSGGKRGVTPEVDFSDPDLSGGPKNLPLDLADRLKKEGYIKDRPRTWYVVAPGDSQIASIYQGKFAQLFKIEGDRVYVQGRVTYDDIFKKQHETLFCYWYTPPSDFVMCNDHNKMN